LLEQSVAARAESGEPRARVTTAALSPADRFGPAPKRHDVDEELRKLDLAMKRAFTAPTNVNDSLTLPMDAFPPQAEEPEFRTALSRALLGEE
jgi:hypothetical protein